MPLTDEQIERWSQYREAMFADTEFMNARRETERERQPNLMDAQSLLQDYMQGRINNNELRNSFQLKTGGAWKTFGLSGFPGAMFLNMLINNVVDQEEVERQLKTVLPVPDSFEDAYKRLSNFMGFLKGITNEQVSKTKPQAGNAPFFVSAWWHLQDTEEWPIYYASGRKAYDADRLYLVSSDKPVDDYFAFRDVFISLMEHLKLSPWEMEALGVWYQERKEAKPQAKLPVVESVRALEDEEDESADESEQVSHSLVQLTLAQIGQKLDCKVWIARNDRSKVVNGERLGDYSIGELPAYIVPEPEARKIIELIDVLWLTGNRGVAAAFEVEHTTSIYSGLLRMSDLRTSQPNLIFPLYIVTSDERIAKVRRELLRPTFQSLQLHEYCGFFSYEELIRNKNSIMRFGKRADAIDALAEYVPTVLNK